MTDYKLSKIYKIKCNVTNKEYYGSTIQNYLSSRLTQHIRNYKKWLKDKKKYVSSFEILKNGDYIIILVDSFESKSKDELRQREQFYIDNYECVNKIRAFRKQEQNKEDYQNNREMRIEKQLNYYYENVTEQSREYRHKNNQAYYEKNKTTVKDKQKAYYLKNKQMYKDNYQRNKDMKKYRKSFDNLIQIDLSIFD